MIEEDFKIQEEMPFATRGYTDLWERCWNGRKVAIKALRFSPDDDQSKITKVRVPFLDPFLGISRKFTVTFRDSAKKWCCGNV